MAVQEAALILTSLQENDKQTVETLLDEGGSLYALNLGDLRPQLTCLPHVCCNLGKQSVTGALHVKRNKLDSTSRAPTW